MDRIEQVQSTSTCIHYLCSQVPVLSLFTISASNQNEHARISTKLREESAKERNSDFCFRNFALLTSLRCKWPKRNTKKNSISLKKPIGTRKSFTATCSTYSYVSDKYECL